MMRKIIALLGLFTFLLAVPQASIAQDERETEARAELDNKKQKSEEEIRKLMTKRHLAGQSKETRKRIKRSLREAERRKKGRSPQPWYDGMFRRKQGKKRKKNS
jgi:hypothetical protein